MDWQRAYDVLRIDPEEPLRARAFTVLLAAAAAGIIIRDGHLLGHFSWMLGLFVFNVWLAESMSVSLPRGEQQVSVGFALVFAGIVIFEPIPAALAVTVGVLLANWAQGKPRNIWLFNSSQVFIAAYVASSVWHMADRGALAEGSTLLLQFPALFFTAAVFFLLNIVLTTVSISLAHRLRPVDVLVDNVKWAVPNFIVLTILGVLIVAVYYSSIGALGVLLLWLPVLMVRYSLQQYMELQVAHVETIQSLAAALDAKDPYTHGHSQRVADFASQIARHFNMRESEIDAIHYAGLLHDIGKIGINDTLLNKPGRLTMEEMAVIRAHPSIGADIVHKVRFLEGIAAMIRHHHEAYDGTGYPAGLAGEDIPQGARILCVADAFDAMISDRTYRRGLTPDEALDELIAGKGTQFDPEVVDVFVDQVYPHIKDTLPLETEVEVDGT